MKITVEQLEDLFFEDEATIDGVELVVVESGEWEQDHKTQSLELIFTDGEKHYCGFIGRSGSPFTDWTYNSEVYGANDLADITVVEKKEITVTRWVVVKGDA